MGIIRGGDAEYDEFAPSYKEKAEKLEETLKLMLGQNSKSIKLSGKYIATDEIKIIGNFLPMKSITVKKLERSVSPEGSVGVPTHINIRS